MTSRLDTNSGKEAALASLISAASGLAGYASSVSEIGTRKIPQLWIDGLQKRVQEYFDRADDYFVELP